MLYQHETLQNCPYCGESIELLIDETAGTQTYYEDCTVCCSPILIVINEDEFGEFVIELRRDDD